MEVLQRDFYYPFGLSMEGAWIAGSTDDPRMDYRYNGKELSQVTGLYAYGARYYDPTIGRFGGVDPLAYQYTPISPYAYVANNPIAFIDPDGMSIASADHDYFDKNGNYLGSDNKGNEIRIIQDYDSSKDFYSQSTLFSDFVYSSTASVGKIAQYYFDKFKISSSGNSVEIRGKVNGPDPMGNTFSGKGTIIDDGKIVSSRLKPIIAIGMTKAGRILDYEGQLNDIYNFGSILGHEYDHFLDTNYDNVSGVSSYHRTDIEAGDNAISLHLHTYLGQLNWKHFDKTTPDFQKSYWKNVNTYINNIQSKDLKHAWSRIFNLI